jgi:hypothetical protein
MKDFLSYQYVYLIPLLLSAIFSLRSFGLKWPAPYRIFSAFLLVTLIVEFFGITWTKFFHESYLWHYNNNNHWIYNSFHILRFSLFAFFYYKMLEPEYIKRIIKYVSFLIIVFGIADYFFIQSPYKMNNYMVILTNISQIFLSLLFFRQLLQAPNIVRLSKHPAVWISLATLLYCSVSLPFFIFYNYLYQGKVQHYVLIYLHDLFNIISYTIYLIAFLCQPYPRQSLSPS